jgi:hypothetical protein
MPDGVLINGKGPYRYNTTLVPDGIQYETVQVDPGNVFPAFIWKMCRTILFIFLCFVGRTCLSVIGFHSWKNMFPHLIGFVWLLGVKYHIWLSVICLSFPLILNVFRYGEFVGTSKFHFNQSTS